MWAKPMRCGAASFKALWFSALMLSTATVQASDADTPSLEMLLFISTFSENESWRDPFEIEQAMAQVRAQKSTDTPAANEKKNHENSTDTAH